MLYRYTACAHGFSPNFMDIYIYCLYIFLGWGGQLYCLVYPLKTELHLLLNQKVKIRFELD